MITLFRDGRRLQPTYSLPTTPTDHVPSLSWLCLQRLADFPDQIHHLPVRLNHDSAHSDVLDGPRPLDPRLWATLAQVYNNLPPYCHTYALPLADPHLLLLQRIPSTPRFSLLTVLDLPACPHLTDSSIFYLSPLHSLVALDASATSLSSYAIKVLAGTLITDAPHRRGPWPLRILRLRYCVNVDDDIYPHLAKFPLLSVIDLRGTDCWPSRGSTFQPSSNPALFHPSPLTAAVESLSGQGLYSSPNIFSLVIGTLNHPPSKAPKSIVVPQEAYVFTKDLKNGESSSAYQLQLHGKKTAVPQRSHDDLGYHSPVYLDRDSEDECTGDEDYGSENGQGESDEEENGDQLRLETLPPSSPQASTPAEPQPMAPGLQIHDVESAPDMFYRKLPPLHISQKYDPVNNYSAEMYYARVLVDRAGKSSSRHDAKLALHRTPPPWSVLETHIARLGETQPRPKSGAGAGMGTAAVNRARMGIQINQARIDALRESASARRRSGVCVTPQTPPARNEGRNPFRRQSISAAEGSSRGAKLLKPIWAVGASGTKNKRSGSAVKKIRVGNR